MRDNHGLFRRQCLPDTNIAPLRADFDDNSSHYHGISTQSHCSYVVPPNRILLNKQCYLRNWQFPLPFFTQSIFLAFHSLVFLLSWNPLFCLLKLTVVQTPDPKNSVIVCWDLHFCIHQTKWGLTSLSTAGEVIIQQPLHTVESSIAWNGTISVSRDSNGAEMPAWQEFKILLARKEEKFMGFLLQVWQSRGS